MSTRGYGNVFVGDCGVGKSTLTNSLVEKIVSKSGTQQNNNEERSLTTQPVKCSWRTSELHGKQYVIDTRGLSSVDDEDRKEGVKQLDELLKQAMNMTIIFVVKFVNGRPRFHDAYIIEIIMRAIERNGGSRNEKINIVVNKCEEDVIQQTKSFGQMFDRTICNERIKVLLGKRYNSPHLLYIQDSKSPQNSSDKLLFNRHDLVSFINKANVSKFSSETASCICADLYGAIFDRSKLEFDHRLQNFEMKFYTKLKPPLLFVLSSVLPHFNGLTKSISRLEERLKQLEEQQQNFNNNQELMKSNVESYLSSTQDVNEVLSSLRDRIEAVELENQQMRDNNEKLLSQVHSNLDICRTTQKGDTNGNSTNTAVPDGELTIPTHVNGKNETKSGSSLRTPNSRIPKIKRRK